ncbi:MAG: VOC family protein [Ardenticatenales bacterium]
MLANATLAAFVATTNPARALAFYRDTLGLPLLRDDGFALVFDANGTPLRVQKVEAVQPPPFTVLGWDVLDIEAAVRGLVAKGVAFERYTFVEQDDLGAWSAPDGTRVAWFKDPDGNLLSVTQHAAA